MFTWDHDVPHGSSMVAAHSDRNHLTGVKPSFHTRHWFAVSLSFLMIDGFRLLLDNTDIPAFHRCDDLRVSHFRSSRISGSRRECSPGITTFRTARRWLLLIPIATI